MPFHVLLVNTKLWFKLFFQIHKASALINQLGKNLPFARPSRELLCIINERKFIPDRNFSRILCGLNADILNASSVRFRWPTWRHFSHKRSQISKFPLSLPSWFSQFWTVSNPTEKYILLFCVSEVESKHFTSTFFRSPKNCWDVYWNSKTRMFSVKNVRNVANEFKFRSFNQGMKKGIIIDMNHVFDVFLFIYSSISLSFYSGFGYFECR